MKKQNTVSKGSIYIALLVLAIGLFSIAVLTKNLRADTNLIKGLISKEEDFSSKKYYATLINYYEPEPNWKPVQTAKSGDQPLIAGTSGMLVDINSSEILMEKDATKPRKIASLTKIMTAIIALEHKNLQTKVYISARAANIGENSMQISEGEVYTLEELLYGLILHSGNDAAYALSEGIAGETSTFVDWMNIKAKELGLENTYFADPSGLSEETYSTPQDLVKLTRYALKNPKFKEIVKTVNQEIVSPSHKYIYLDNQTNLLTTYPGVAGVKTGYTEDAGLCLVTYAVNDGVELVGVVLNSIDRKGDMVLMLDHGFYKQGINIVHHLLD